MFLLLHECVCMCVVQACVRVCIRVCVCVCVCGFACACVCVQQSHHTDRCKDATTKGYEDRCSQVVQDNCLILNEPVARAGSTPLGSCDHYWSAQGLFEV